MRDQNWFAHNQSNPFGVGYYEYAVNANGTNLLSVGGYDDTDVFGVFAMSNLVAGSYTVASWDVWWRSAYLFNVPVPTSGNSVDVSLRLKSTMWGYPAFWDTTGYYEFGHTFVATGPISMIYLRLPSFAGAPSYTLTVHDGRPGGPQVGVSRSFGTGDQAAYLRLRGNANHGWTQLLYPHPHIVHRCEWSDHANGSRPDYSDPMPGGSLWLGLLPPA